MNTSVRWELTCNGLVPHPGGVKDTMYWKSEISTDSIGHLARKGFSFTCAHAIYHKYEHDFSSRLVALS